MHNDVFEMAENRVNTECSALTRAGISIRYDETLPGFLVPPSQGRVYRTGAETAILFVGSALTRAGISVICGTLGEIPKFRPHKGGYIAVGAIYE